MPQDRRARVLGHILRRLALLAAAYAPAPPPTHPNVLRARVADVAGVTRSVAHSVASPSGQRRMHLKLHLQRPRFPGQELYYNVKPTFGPAARRTPRVSSAAKLQVPAHSPTITPPKSWGSVRSPPPSPRAPIPPTHAGAGPLDAAPQGRRRFHTFRSHRQLEHPRGRAAKGKNRTSTGHQPSHRTLTLKWNGVPPRTHNRRHNSVDRDCGSNARHTSAPSGASLPGYIR